MAENLDPVQIARLVLQLLAPLALALPDLSAETETRREVAAGVQQWVKRGVMNRWMKHLSVAAQRLDELLKEHSRVVRIAHALDGIMEGNKNAVPDRRQMVRKAFERMLPVDGEAPECETRESCGSEQYVTRAVTKREAAVDKVIAMLAEPGGDRGYADKVAKTLCKYQRLQAGSSRVQKIRRVLVTGRPLPRGEVRSLEIARALRDYDAGLFMRDALNLAIRAVVQDRCQCSDEQIEKAVSAAWCVLQNHAI